MYFPLCLFRSQSCVPGQSILSPKIASFTTVYTLFHCIIITILKQDQNGGSFSTFVLLLLFTRAIRKTASSTLSAASQLIFAHKMALPPYLFVSRSSCEHEICSQTVRVNCNQKLKSFLGFGRNDWRFLKKMDIILSTGNEKTVSEKTGQWSFQKPDLQPVVTQNGAAVR